MKGKLDKDYSQGAVTHFTLKNTALKGDLSNSFVFKFLSNFTHK